MRTSTSPAADRRSRSRESSVASSCTIDFDTDDEVQEAGFIDNAIDLTSGAFAFQPVNSSYTAGPQPRTKEFCVGDVLEVQNIMLFQYPVEFIKVTVRLNRNTLYESFEGLAYTRTRNLRGQLPKKHNEVCMMLQYRRQHGHLLDAQPVSVTVKLESVVRKRIMILTNAIYPEFASSRARQTSAMSKTEQLARGEEDAAIVCRWKWLATLIDSGRSSKVDEEALERITPEEVSEPHFLVPEQTLCNRWRGGRHRGGSWHRSHYQVLQCDDTEASDEPAESVRMRGQQYTLFDAFSGARGVSRGAQGAGFKVTHAVDKDPAVWDTYTANFPDALLYKMSVDCFVRQASDLSPHRPDILHMSPPCQFFSPAHTRSGALDEENTDALLCCHELVRTLRPRLLTLEETFGLKFEQHRAYFNSLVGDLTRQGYSVRWRIVDLCTWGSVQTRKRLVLLAAGPGERLPPFPLATHSNIVGDTLLPYTTIRKALGRVQVGDDLHDLAAAPRFSPPRRRLDFDTQIGTILTNSADNLYYPDGTRDYTLREYACLQGFPISHQFRGTKTNIRRQIGNAFPPNTVKLLYKHLEAWLLKQDRMETDRLSLNQCTILDVEHTNGETDRGSLATNMHWGRNTASACISGTSSINDNHIIIVDLT